MEIHTASKVVSVDTQTATITLKDGSSHTADVVIGADGVHSATRKFLSPGVTPEPFQGKHNAFRFIIERADALRAPETKPFVETEGSLDMWYSADRKIIMYPTSHNKLLNFACIHPAELSATSQSQDIDDYTEAASKSNMLELYKDFHPGLRKLLEMADPLLLKIYPLWDMPNLPTFVSGRLAVLGDAAHPFTPHLGQGGAMAIEDGASLGVFLQKSTLPAEVPERLQLYNTARYERASTIQQYSRLLGGDGTGKDSKESAQFKGKKDIYLTNFPPKQTNYVSQPTNTSKAPLATTKSTPQPTSSATTSGRSNPLAGASPPCSALSPAPAKMSMEIHTFTPCATPPPPKRSSCSRLAPRSSVTSFLTADISSTSLTRSPQRRSRSRRLEIWRGWAEAGIICWHCISMVLATKRRMGVFAKARFVR